MNASKNEITTLISILSITYPTQYPKKESIDELDSFLPAINFPSYSLSEIDSFTLIFQNKTTFKEIIEYLHFYFPFVPSILQIISNYKQDTTEETLNVCACIVMCSYISWRAFCEYTKNFEHIPYILNCIPLVSKSKYANIITNIYCDCLNYYLNECPSFNFYFIFASMELLLKKESINILSQMQTIFYTILSQKFITQSDSEFSTDCQIFINYLCHLTDISPDIFESKVAKDIIILLTNQIESIEINSLHLFSNLFHKIEREVTIPIFSIFPISYYKHIMSIQHSIDIPEEQPQKMTIKFPEFELKKVTELTANNSNFSLIEGTFLNGFPQISPSMVKKKSSNGFLLNDETREILFYIARAAQNDDECKDIIIKDFNSFIVQKDNKNHFILLYSLIYAVSNLNLNQKQAKAYWNILLTSEIFSEKNFGLIQTSGQITSQIRSEAIDSMILSGYKEIHSFLLNLIKNQLLLTEIFQRLYLNSTFISKEEFLSTDFLLFIINFFNYLQKLNLIEKDKDIIEIIESTRYCILHLISQGLSINEVAVFWFSLPFFTDFFSSLIFENSLRGYILEQYKQYLLNYFHQNDQVFILGIKKLFELIQFDSTFSISIEFVKMMNSVLSMKYRCDSASVDLFHELIDVIADTLTVIEYNSKESHLYFIQVLHTFLFVKLNDKYYSILKETAKKLNEEKDNCFYQQIKEELFKLVSCNNYNRSEIFPLQQAKIILIILENIENNKNNEKLINYLEKEIHPLLKKSIYNCYQAYNFGIEKFLIEKLKSLQNDKSFNYDYSIKIMNILSTIYSIKGSVDSAQNFIELLFPVDLKHVSGLSPYYLQSLTTLFNSYSNTPNCYFPLSSRINILNVDSSFFHKSFELSFWCFIEPYKIQNSMSQVLSILDSKEKGIKVHFLDNKILISYYKKHEEIIEFDVTFPKGKWHLIQIKFIFDQQPSISRQSSQSSIESTSNSPKNKYGSKSFNNSDYSPLALFNTQPISRSPILSQLSQPFSSLKKNPFNFSLSTSFSNLSDLNNGFGGLSNVKFKATILVVVDGEESEMKELNLRKFSDKTVTIKIGSDSDLISKSYFACFSIFPCYIQERNFFNWDNDMCQIVSPINPLLTVNFEKNNDLIKPVCKPNDLAVINSNQTLLRVSSLADVFIEKVMIQSVILLFAEFDLLTIKEAKVLAYADFTVEMIAAFIQCGKNAQISFYENNCTEAIAHLLSLCDPSNLNFSIYLQITALLTSIVIPDLKQKMLTMIVLNFDIWGRAEFEVFRLITQHWAQNLFSDYKEKMKEITSLPFLLYIMKEHYKHNKIVNNLCNLFVKIAEIEFTSQDFLNIIEYCTINTEIKLVISYLELLKRTLSSRKESDPIISHHIQFISLLHNLLKLNDDSIFCLVIEIVTICHQKNFIKSKSLSFQQHINMIMNKVTVGNCTMNSLEKIVNLSNQTNQSLYQLCCLIALNQGKEAIEYLSQSIKPSKYLVSSLDRLLWIVMLLTSIENVEKQKEFCILYNQNYTKIRETCILIQIISAACGKNADQQLNSFLSLEFNLISENRESFQPDFVHKMLKIAYMSLLFHSKTLIDDWIQKVVENSPFNDQTVNETNCRISQTADSDNEKKFLRREEIYRKIEEIGNSKQKAVSRFCPRLDENGNWVESPLALQCLKMFEIYFNSNLLNFDLILCAFIFKVNPELALSHLQRINVSNYVSKIPSNLISFVFYSAESKGVDLKPIFGLKQNYSKFGGFCFLHEFSDQIKTDFFESDVVKMASEVFSLYDQSYKIERNFETFSNGSQKEMNLIVSDQIRTQRMILRFDILHVWQQMWNEMSRPKGRWNIVRNAAAVKNHFKRSSRLIYNDHSNSYYPLKMALNNEFYNDHIDASILRDVGSVKEAKIKVESYRNRKKSYGVFFSTLRPLIFNPNSNYYEHFSLSSLSYKKYMKNNPAFRKEAILVRPKGCKEGLFEVFFDAFVINKKIILFSEIREICLRRRFHRPTAFEIFKKNGKSYFIEIPNYNSANLMKYFLPFMSTMTIQDYTEKWVNYEITTFEYLMKLNEFSSRTFNDLSAYPIMPWVISDYQSDKIDIDDPKIYRDLSKPMGAINEDRLIKLKQNSVNTGELIPVHLYPNGYISPLIVLSYLVRIEPFTSIHINYHGRKFEASTKIFKSISLAYKNATSLSSNFMELIPEFFTMPEFLLNKENFDLTGPENKKPISKGLDDELNNNNIEIQGNSIIPDCSNSIDQISIENQRSSSNSSLNLSSTVNETDKNESSYSPKSKCPGYVKLPKWAMNSSNVFIYMNRKALESNHTSMNIHKWIDLIWGYKQTGPEAEKADNTFYPLMYSDVWSKLDKKEFNIKPKQVETILSEVGQIPIQLFTSPHPQRQPLSQRNARFQSLLKNEETIMFGINQIVFSKFSTVKTDDLSNSNLSGNLVIGSSIKSSAKASQKSQKSRDLAVSGIVVDSASKLICLNIKSKSVTTVYNESFEKQTSFISASKYAKLCSIGDVMTSSMFVCLSDGFRSFILYKPFEKVSTKSGYVNYSISHISIEGKMIVTAGSNLMSVWSIDDLSKPLFTLPTYRSEICCVSISPSFDLFVSATRDSYVQFNSIEMQRNINISEIGDVVPKFIKVTPGLGFVLVYGSMQSTINLNSNFLILFSSNGHKIRQVEIPPGEELTAIEVYRSYDGFDFAFVATEKGNLYHFEVFFTKFDKPFYKAPFYINSMSYMLEQGVLYCTGKDNSILVVPYSA